MRYSSKLLIIEILRFIINGLKVVAVILVVYNEILSFLMLPLHWADQRSCDPPDCTKVLLVADPQILGVQDSSFVARWDADRYLKRTFAKALEYTTPDLIIFLGDLMDEGHISDDAQFSSALKRFRDIFHIPEKFSSASIIYVPGDNDIGGEEDPILPHVVRRFDKLFDQSLEPITHGSLEILKINRMTSMFQEPAEFREDVFRIGLSHMPVLLKIHTLSKRVASEVRPHMIFSGHDHLAFHISAPTDDPWLKTVDDLRVNFKLWRHYPLRSDLIHELVVPTCSYRMGVPLMGYGMAHIDMADKELSYAVLWLPSRLDHLRAYLWYGIVTSLLLMCLFVVTLKRKIQRLIRNLYPNSIVRRFKSIP